jgi:hypothetical protein
MQPHTSVNKWISLLKEAFFKQSPREYVAKSAKYCIKAAMRYYMFEKDFINRLLPTFKIFPKNANFIL